MTEWYLIDDVPIANTVFDVIAKYYDPKMDRFWVQRFTDCIQVDGVVVWHSPFDKFYQSETRDAVRLVDHGYRPTHWMEAPNGPLE